MLVLRCYRLPTLKSQSELFDVALGTQVTHYPMKHRYAAHEETREYITIPDLKGFAAANSHIGKIDDVSSSLIPW